MSVSSCCATSGRSEGTTGSPPASGGSGIVPVAWKLLRPAVSVWVGVVSRAVVVSSMGASRQGPDAWTVSLSRPPVGRVPRGRARHSPDRHREFRCPPDGVILAPQRGREAAPRRCPGRGRVAERAVARRVVSRGGRTRRGGPGRGGGGRGGCGGGRARPGVHGR